MEITVETNVWVRAVSQDDVKQSKKIIKVLQERNNNRYLVI
jgi:predicted nucleic-acid-binding protein